MKNNSSQSRFGKITAKAIVVLLAVVMALSVLPALSADILPDANAATAYVVQAGEKRPDIDANLQRLVNEGNTEIDMTLSADIDLRTQGYTQGITIPKGATVNLYLNNHTISYIIPDGNPYWQSAGIYGIINNGTLNIYAGSSKTPSASDKGSIVIKTVLNAKPKTSGTIAYQRAEAIQNNGVLTVNKNVNITSDIVFNFQRTDATGEYDRDASATVAVAGIYNTSASAVATVNGAKITANASSASVNADFGGAGGKDDSASNSFAYGIYGGIINIAGDATISVSANTACDQNGGAGTRQDGDTTAVAYGVCSTGKITMTGGTISYSTYDYNKADSLSDGTRYVYQGGICCDKNGATPTIIDGSIKVATTDSFFGEDEDDYAQGTRVFSESTVATATKMPYSPADIYGEASGNLYLNPESGNGRPSGIAAGSFTDEIGNVYNASSTTTIGAHPTSLNRGALAGQNRVHVVYRFWTDSTRNTLDTSVRDGDDNLGYSFRPLTANPQIVLNPVVLNISNTKLTTGNNTAILYKNGGDPCNTYYWNLYRVSYRAAGNTFFSDFAITQRGTDFQTFGSNASSGQAPVSNGPIYIFVDYVSKAPTVIKSTVGTANVVTTTYTGSSILASNIGLKITNVTESGKDITAEYDLDLNSTESLIDVTYSYTGKNTLGIEESSESGGLPRNAGEYDVTLHINESVTYNPDPNKSRNRKGLEYTFKLFIEKAEALRGTLPETLELTYGEKLNQKLDVDTIKASFYGYDTVNGKFSFKNSGDGNAYKNAGTGTVQLVWTPTAGDNIVEMNYKETVFSVSYTVKKQPLYVKANAASVVYGDIAEAFTKAFTAEIYTESNSSGLVATDNTESNINAIKNAVVYTVYFGGDYIAYRPGVISAGSHLIKANIPKDNNIPAVLDNYEIIPIYGTDANSQGVLTVTPRPITVEATAQDRAYIPGDYNVNVSFEITDGKFGTNDIRVDDAVGKLSDCNAGEAKIVNNISVDTIKDKLAGGAKANYEITKVTYKTGANLLVNITKAIPDAATPTVAEMNYLQKRTLADVDFGKTAGTVEGSWQWVDSKINPTVNVAYYKAQFVPVDQKNYENKVVDVFINVKPTIINVGYSATVSYGDNVPNITNYSYTSDYDKDFDIKLVTTSGNITPRTDYQKGSPVKEGGYVVTITAPNYVDVDGNYIFNVSNGIINVNPRLITFKVQDKTITYGDSFYVNATGAVDITFDESLLVGTDTINSLTASGIAPVFGFDTNFTNHDNYAVGEYELRATFTGATSANYDIAVENGTLHVTEAPLVIKANDFVLEYGSDVPKNLESALTLIGAKKNENLGKIYEGTIKVETDYEKGAPVTAEGYTVAVDIANATFKNYKVTVQNGTITVIKATPVITTLPTATIVYGQTLADAQFSGQVIENNIKGTFVYETSTLAPGYSDVAYNIFKASFVPEDTDNYNVIRGQVISLTVSKKPISGILSVAGVPMIGGDGLTVDVTGLDPATAGSYSFVWYDADGNKLGTGEKLPLGENLANKKIYVTATAATPYEGTKTSAYVLIAPKLTDINTILATEVFVLSGLSELGATKEFCYDAKDKAVTFQKDDKKSAGYEIGRITVKYNGSEKELPRNVGTYVVTIDVAAPTDLTGLKYDENAKVYKNESGAIVYSPVSNYKLGTLVITPAEYKITVTIADKVYDGTVDATATDVKESGKIQFTDGGYDDVWFDNDAVTYYFDTPDAGTQKKVKSFDGNYLKGTAADNYKLVININNADSAVITPRPLNVTVSAVEREYIPGNNEVDLAFDFKPVAGDEGLVDVNASEAKGTIDPVTAGEHSVKLSGITLTGDKAANYQLVIVNEGDVKVNILAREPSYPIPEIDTVLYYDSNRRLSSIALPESKDGSWAWENPNAVPGAGVHKFKAVYTPNDTTNYREVEYDVAIDIRKTPVIITAASFTITYGDIEPTYFYTVQHINEKGELKDNLTGSDTIENAVDGYALLNCNYQPGGKVGNYTIMIDGAFESDNYEFTYINGNVTVGKRTAYVDVLPESREYKEGDKTVQVKFSALENLYSGDSASDVYLNYTGSITGSITDADAGTKTVKYEMPKLLGTKAENYVISPKKTTVTVEILKAVYADVNLPKSGKVYYGNKLSTVEFTSGSEGGQYGTFTMENPSSVPEAVGTFANTYKVVFTPKDTKNYATISDYITIEVLPAYINVSIHFTGTIQVGKTLYVILNDVPAEAIPNLVYEWYRVESPEADPKTGVKIDCNVDYYQLKEEDAGKYIMCAVTNADGSPYECNSICVSEIAVEEQQLTFWQKFVNWFYKLISNFTQLFGGMLG